jgi:hypothetical protein
MAVARQLDTIGLLLKAASSGLISKLDHYPSSSSYLVREVRSELEPNLIWFVRAPWPVKWTSRPQSPRIKLVVPDT